MLRRRFDALWTRTVGAGPGATAWDTLDAGYGDPVRAYHGWTHIAAMLTGLDAASADPDVAGIAFDEVELAVFFHDAVYDPRRHDNEAASAALFAEEAGAQPPIGHEGVRRVRDLILATADHRPSADTATRLLLDLDLSILGSAPETYAAYVAAIRLEYAHVGDGPWRLGRGVVLGRFLGRSHIFQTAAFHRGGEDRARANIESELIAMET